MTKHELSPKTSSSRTITRRTNRKSSKPSWKDSGARFWFFKEKRHRTLEQSITKGMWNLTSNGTMPQSITHSQREYQSGSSCDAEVKRKLSLMQQRTRPENLGPGPLASLEVTDREQEQTYMTSAKHCGRERGWLKSMTSLDPYWQNIQDTTDSLSLCTCLFCAQMDLTWCSVSDPPGLERQELSWSNILPLGMTPPSSPSIPLPWEEVDSGWMDMTNTK